MYDWTIMNTTQWHVQLGDVPFIKKIVESSTQNVINLYISMFPKISHKIKNNVIVLVITSHYKKLYEIIIFH